MAKEKLEVHSHKVPFGDVMWVKAWNQARESGDYGSEQKQKELQTSLATDGWWSDGSTNSITLVSSIEDNWIIDGKSTPLKEALPAEMELRKKRWDAYLVDSTQNEKKAKALLAFETLFVIVVKGKKELRIPKWVAVTSNRRASLYLDAMIERLIKVQVQDESDTTPVVPLTVIDSIPIQPGDYSSAIHRLSKQSDENEQKTKGFSAASPLDQFLTSKRMVGMGMTQANLRERFTPTLGVKYYLLVLLAAKFPNLNIVERCKLRPANAEGITNPDYIHLPSVSHADLQSFAGRLTPQATDEYNEKHRNRTNAAPLPMTTEALLRNYFANLKNKPGKGGVNQMDKANIHSISVGNDDLKSQQAAAAILQNDKTYFDQQRMVARGHNALIALTEQGDYPSAEAILEGLTRIAAGELRQKAFTNIKQILGIKDTATTA